MAYSDFISLYAANNKLSADQLLAERPLRFALMTNDRGDALIRSVRSWSGFKLDGKRTLDVGCAYGGLAVALAKAGASVTGLESNPKLLAYAEANAFGASTIEFMSGDLSTLMVKQKLPPKSFDYIFLNDTLERSYDVDGVIANIDYLLADSGVVHFKTINANAARYMLADAHKKLFGLPLVDPDQVHLYKLKKSPVYYRPITTYLALFQYYGMPKHAFADEERILIRGSARRLSGQIRSVFAEARSEAKRDPALLAVLRMQTTKVRDRFVFDLRSYGEDFVKVKYGTLFFSGVVGRANADLTVAGVKANLPDFGALAEVSELDDKSEQKAA